MLLCTHVLGHIQRLAKNHVNGTANFDKQHEQNFPVNKYVPRAEGAGKEGNTALTVFCPGSKNRPTLYQVPPGECHNSQWRKAVRIRRHLTISNVIQLQTGTKVEHSDKPSAGLSLGCISMNNDTQIDRTLSSHLFTDVRQLSEFTKRVKENL